MLPPELGMGLAALESHGLRTEESVGFSKKIVGLGYQRRVDEFCILKMTNEKA